MIFSERIPKKIDYRKLRFNGLKLFSIKWCLFECWPDWWRDWDIISVRVFCVTTRFECWPDWWRDWDTRPTAKFVFFHYVRMLTWLMKGLRHFFAHEKFSHYLRSNVDLIDEGIETMTPSMNKSYFHCSNVDLIDEGIETQSCKSKMLVYWRSNVDLIDEGIETFEAYSDGRHQS